MDTTSLELVETQRGVEPTTANQKRLTRFLDFVVGGEPLYPVMQRGGFDVTTPLWFDAPIEVVSEDVERLLGNRPGDAPHGRVSIYVCAECGDLGCGAVTVRLVCDSESVQWRDWGYQNNYEEDIYSDGLADLPDISFNRREYEAVLAEALSRLRGDE